MTRWRRESRRLSLVGLLYASVETSPHIGCVMQLRLAQLSHRKVTDGVIDKEQDQFHLRIGTVMP